MEEEKQKEKEHDTVDVAATEGGKNHILSSSNIIDIGPLLSTVYRLWHSTQI